MLTHARDYRAGVAQLAARVVADRPLIHAVTNFVTMEWVARGIAAAGASPVMALDVTETAAVAGQATALLLNLGTWQPYRLAAMLAAGRAAAERGRPIVLDPVGVASSPARLAGARNLLTQLPVACVRGNLAELAALAGVPIRAHGVESRPDEATRALGEQVAQQVAQQYQLCVAITGEVDLIAAPGLPVLSLSGGSEQMGRIPGMGCLAGALVATALAVLPEGTDLAVRQEQVRLALAWSKLAGEQAGATAVGPGTFAVRYLDELAALGTR